MAVQYRPAKPEDADAIAHVNRMAFNALSRLRGFPEAPPFPPHPFQLFSLQQESEGCWVGEDGGNIVGFSINWVRGSFWFLAYLFVLPEYQGQGVGRTLMDRAMAHGGKEADNRALITFAYNPVSVSLYVRYGLYPYEPLYLLEGPAEAVRQVLTEDDLGEHERLAAGDASARLLGEIDEHVLGVARIKHHQFLLNAPDSACYAFRSGGGPEGYAYIWPTGRVGPMAVRSRKAFERAMKAGLALAGSRSTDRVSLLLAGSNTPGMSWAVRNGMEITLPMLLMSSKRFGQLESYLFHSATVM